ncbi:AMP-binding protein [Streptomyces sanyensis]|uniref:AMP-binding protein n=1 Tax=Streptomyces sanyensis TaxID=568869 RepID=UPI003D77F13E
MTVPGPRQAALPPSSFTELLRDRAELTPERPAIIVDGVAELTFADWDRRADAAAHRLRAFEPARLRRVALLFGGDAWADFAVAYHAVQRVGATAIHLNDRMPGEEIARRLVHCGANGILHADGLRPPDGFTGWTAPLGSLEGAADDAPARPDAARPPVRPDAIADILYSSGTTGPAKAVTVTHANMMHGRARPTIDALGSSEHLLSAMPLGTSSSQGTISLPLLSDSVLVAASLSDEPDRIAELAARYRVGSLMITPATARALVLARVHERHDLSGVTTVTSASAVFPAAVARRLLAMLPGASLATAYTSIEASPAVVLNVFDPDHPLCAGFPAPGTDVVITDERQQPLPTGEVGEIWLGTDAPQRRYLDTLLDRQAHVGRWTRMGDLGSLDDQGRLHFFDRAADAVRSDGRLVSTVQVESVLYDHPEVREAAVIGLPHPGSGEETTAVVVLSSAAVLPQVEDFVKSRLEPHQIPGRYLVTDALPRSFLGKVLKRELRRIHTTPSPRSHHEAADRHAAEPEEPAVPLDPELLDVLGCPEHPDAGLRHDADHSALTCADCGRRYPVLRGIPVLLPGAGD